VVIAAALRTNAPIIALHLTRPPIAIPDRAALGMPSHFEAAKGAYVLRPYRDGERAWATVVVQGTSTTNNVVKILNRLDAERINVKDRSGDQPATFRAPAQDLSQRRVLRYRPDGRDGGHEPRAPAHVGLDGSWVSGEYTLSSDWDDRWRTGGTVDEVIEKPISRRTISMRGSAVRHRSQREARADPRDRRGDREDRGLGPGVFRPAAPGRALEDRAAFAIGQRLGNPIY